MFFHFPLGYISTSSIFFLDITIYFQRTEFREKKKSVKINAFNWVVEDDSRNSQFFQIAFHQLVLQAFSALLQFASHSAKIMKITDKMNIQEIQIMGAKINIGCKATPIIIRH